MKLTSLYFLIVVILAVVGYKRIMKKLWGILEIQHLQMQAGLHINNLNHALLTRTIDGMEAQEDDVLNGWLEKESVPKH